MAIFYDPVANPSIHIQKLIEVIPKPVKNEYDGYYKDWTPEQLAGDNPKGDDYSNYIDDFTEEQLSKTPHLHAHILKI